METKNRAICGDALRRAERLWFNGCRKGVSHGNVRNRVRRGHGMGFFAAMGSPGALRVGDAFLIGLVLIGCVVGFALLVAVPFGIIGMIFAAAFA